MPFGTAQSLSFGGKDGEILFVTSTYFLFDLNSAAHLNETVPDNWGKLYAITGLGVNGQIATRALSKYASCVANTSA